MGPIAHAATTTTQLSIATPTVTVGTPTLLVATVTDAANHAVLHGTVTFYDGSRALGSAQIVSLAGGSFTQGTANLKTASFTTGANSITAVFAGTKTDSPSRSSAKTVTVTGTYTTSIALSETLNSAQYTLTAILQSFGVGTPTGSIDFLDTTTDASLGTAPLSGATLRARLLIRSMPTVGGEPGGVVAGDFDGDGFLDLATANNEGGISVLIGNGDGTFKTQVTYGAGGFPANIYTGDFNNDGKLDLAVVNYFDGAVGILLGNGDGTFQPQIEYGSVDGAVEAKIADFDNDGNQDFVMTDRGGNDVAVLLGNGDGTFQSQKTYATGSGPWAVQVGDLNGDGIPDLLVTAGDYVSELLGKGDGTFLPQTVLELGAFGNGPYMALGDVNGDGKLDVVLGNNQLNTVSVSLGKGNGMFEPTETYSLDGSPGQPVILDVNQDGIPDIAVTNWDNNDIEVLLGTGGGSFQPAVSYVTTTQVPNFMIQGDFNGDGRPDLVATTSDGNAETVILNAETATLQLPNVSVPAPGSALVQASYPGDGKFSSSISNSVRLGTGNVDFSGGFAGAGGSVQLNGDTTVNGSDLALTNGGTYQSGSAFYAAPVNVGAFTTDFTFEEQGAVADGFTFTIQNAGPTAKGGNGAGLGFVTIQHSVAIKFDLYNNVGEGPNSTGVYLDGNLPTVPAVDLTGSGINLHSTDPIHAHVTYDGVNLTMTLTDTLSLANWSHSWVVNIPKTVGRSTAYVGFTGSTGGGTATQTISSWTYVAGTPAPNYPDGFEATGLSLNGSSEIPGSALQLTNGGLYQAASAFYLTPQLVQRFTTDFTFLLVNPVADGFTFAIQNDSPQQLGGTGAGLGFVTIQHSVAIKFDLYNNVGEGPNSTGLYLDGNLPTVPSVDLTGSGINLHSEDPIKAHITYDGTTLTMTLTDAVTLASWSDSWPVNIPKTVNGATAYVGFTGATGGGTSTQLITSWTYLPGVVSP
jgi:Legume lectin domain/Bacterial Ig-like domain (group 3)/FG-GAP-like repeat